WVIAHGNAILIVFFCTLCILVYGMTKIQVDLNTRKMLGTRLPHVYDQVHAGESKIGSMYSYDIMLTFPDENRIADPAVLNKFDDFTRIIRNQPLIKKTRSATDILKEINQITHNDDQEFYSIPDDRDIISSWISIYERGAPDDAKNWYNKKHTTLRLFVEVSDFSAVEFQKQIRLINEKIAEFFPDTDYPGLRHDIVGNLLQISVMNQYVTTGQIMSIVFSLLSIMIMMMIVFGSVKLGLIGMIPNIAPVIVAGGVMGFMKVPLEFVTMTIAPMVLGLSVDDTIHFTNSAKLEYYRQGNYTDAVLSSFVATGKPMTKATIILCSTFIAFLFSVVNNMINMGIYTVLAMGFALLADLLVTPVLIMKVKPFGVPRQQ
ncbi:MAG: MMPL family transporter, partial [Thermodesulfobacteriota bacterium]